MGEKNKSGGGGAGVKRVHAMSCGFFDFPSDYILPGDEESAGGTVRIEIGMFLLEHERGNILIDTGCAVECASDPAAYWGEEAAAWGRLSMSRDDAADMQLAKLGFRIEDVSHVVLTHLHLDHAGGMSLFPGASIYMQKKELAAAMRPEPEFSTGYYEPKDFAGAGGLNIIEIDGDFDIFGDGSVRLIFTGGHSRGHQMVLAKTSDGGELLLPGDACFNRRA
ncbi:MAG TPA: N-acyl homoserine lactonase family protein, partial [bacterium]|nr:N-acyl homoserine lactonase family protein [bacterium]